jgi:hypothetical protein
MDRKDLIKTILVIVVVVFFITESFYFGGGYFKPSTSSGSGSNMTGNSVFNGTIRTYDPLLFLPLNTSQQVLDQLDGRSEVRSVKADTNAYVITTETRDDVYPLAAWLRTMNVTSFAIANIAVSVIPVDTLGGTINASVPNGVVRVVAEPLLDVDNEVTVSLVATVNDGQLVGTQSESILLQPVEAIIDARVESIDDRSYQYSIPWANRTTLALAGYDSHYTRVDTIIFRSPLNVSQILAKKQFPYITYIDANSAQVAQDFDNVTMLEINFADTPFTLPPSQLTISANETPDVPFNYTLYYTYSLVPINTTYDFGDKPLVVQTTNSYEENSTIGLNVSATALGDKIISIKRAGLPS